MRKKGRHIAPVVDQLKRRVKVTHPFHPRFGEELELVQYKRSWGRERVDCLDAEGCLVSVPLSCTDAFDADPFVVISAGRSFFRSEDLLRLVDLLKGLNS